jgi:hypothetical protein
LIYVIITLIFGDTIKMTKLGKNNNVGNFNRSSIVWLVIYIGIALAISITVPFPMSFILYIGIYLLLQNYRIKSIEKRYYYPSTLDKGDNKTKNKRSYKFFKSISNTLFGDNLYSQFESQPLKFICMNCGKEHSGRSCPLCGSSAVRLG